MSVLIVPDAPQVFELPTHPSRAPRDASLVRHIVRLTESGLGLGEARRGSDELPFADGSVRALFHLPISLALSHADLVYSVAHGARVERLHCRAIGRDAASTLYHVQWAPSWIPIA
ncbi:MAG: hypothetical protein Q7V62_03675 [Actinomycetota bacterium]|nr:hypothetical protein [Actinomycetota bacterium]